MDAINDGNVLPFRIDYVDTVRKKENIRDKDVRAIDIEKALGAPERIQEIVKYILVVYPVSNKTLRRWGNKVYFSKTDWRMEKCHAIL